MVMGEWKMELEKSFLNIGGIVIYDEGKFQNIVVGYDGGIIDAKIDVKEFINKIAKLLLEKS
jgi:hypothetical protein